MLHDVPIVGISNLDRVDATVQKHLASALQSVSSENLLQVPQVQELLILIQWASLLMHELVQN